MLVSKITNAGSAPDDLVRKILETEKGLPESFSKGLNHMPLGKINIMGCHLS